MAYTTIDDPTIYFNTKLYTGNNTDGTQITNDGSSNLQPDWLWIKNRTDSGGAPATGGLWDSVRGFSENKVLTTFSTNEEGANSNGFAVATTNGFTVEDGTSGSNPRTATNLNAKNYVAWQWKETATAGFDIVSYTGNGSNPRTISHNLSAVPKMIIVKNRDQGTDWNIYHEKIGNDKTILLNTTNAAFDSSVWNDTTPTSSVFSLGANDVNTNNIKYIAYCFAEKKGYSKFSSYIGNANANGTFVYTGFKPAFVIAKLTSVGGENWYVWDNKRSTGNVMDKFLYANLSNAEVTSSSLIDFLSNGFKLRTGGDFLNANGETHIYMAFAENPFVTSTGIPTTAR